MFHPTFGTVREVAHEHVESWKAQGWRLSAPKGKSGGDVEAPTGETQAETPEPVAAHDDE